METTIAILLILLCISSSANIAFTLLALFKKGE